MNAREIIEAVANCLCDLVEKCGTENLYHYNICLYRGEVDWWTDVGKPRGALELLSGEYMDNQLDDEEIRANWDSEDFRKWVHCILDEASVCEAIRADEEENSED